MSGILSNITRCEKAWGSITQKERKNQSIKPQQETIQMFELVDKVIKIATTISHRFLKLEKKDSCVKQRHGLYIK